MLLKWVHNFTISALQAVINRMGTGEIKVGNSTRFRYVSVQFGFCKSMLNRYNVCCGPVSIVFKKIKVVADGTRWRNKQKS